MTRILFVSVAAILYSALLASTARADDERKLGWFFTGEFSSVIATGNSESNTFGIIATLRRVWPRSESKVEGGGLRTESTTTTRTAVGTTESFDVEETKTTEKTAESYFLRGRYDFDVSKRFFVFGGGDWLRNTFAGIDSRFLIAAGAGNTWANTQEVRFKTDYSLTYTFQQDVIENPLFKSDFPGLRASSDLSWRVAESMEFLNVIIADFNLDNTDDVRLDVTSSFPVEISSALFFKPTYQVLWRNQPALTEIPLGGSGETVTAPLGKTDTFFKMALVVKL